MITYINQPFGLGDCIWAMSLVERFRADSQRIIWPVVTQYVEGLQRAYPAIEWVDHSKHQCPVDMPIPYESDGVRVVPLRWASQMMGLPDSECMRAKYAIYGIDWQSWKDVAWQRDKEAEWRLLERINPPERFALVSDTYQTGMNAKVPISVNGLPIVKVQAIPGFSLFDWAAVMKRATEIHQVSSAMLYLTELLDLSCPLHLYPRATDPNFEHVRFLLTKDYILHAPR